MQALLVPMMNGAGQLGMSAGGGSYSVMSAETGSLRSPSDGTNTERMMGLSTAKGASKVGVLRSPWGRTTLACDYTCNLAHFCPRKQPGSLRVVRAGGSYAHCATHALPRLRFRVAACWCHLMLASLAAVL